MAVSLLSASVFAQTVEVNETFDYTGALTSNGWTMHSGTAGQLQAASGVANTVAGNSEDANKALTTSYAITTGMLNKITYSATVKVLNSTSLTTTGDYFMSLGATTGASVTILPARVYVKAGTTGYLLGVLNTSGGTVTPTYSTTEIPYGTAANILLTYTVNSTATPTQAATLQIDSQPLLSNNTGTGSASSNIASIVIRQAGNTTSGTGNIEIDNIVVTSYPASVLAVSDVINTKGVFVRNTLVSDEINFGSKSDVKVYNMNGQVVKTASVSENKNLEVADLQPGMYIVTGTVNGEPVSRKILKK